MRIRITIICFSIVWPLMMYGQEADIQTVAMSEGVQQAVVTAIEGVDDRRVERLWDDFITNYGGDTKRVRKENEYQTKNASIVMVAGTNPVDVYFSAEEQGTGTRISIWFKVEGSFLDYTGNPGMEKQAIVFAKKFVHELKLYRVNEQLEEEEKKLADLEKELDKLQRLKDRYHDQIERAKEEIAENEQNIVENDAMQEAKDQEIDNQKKVIQTVVELLNQLRTNIPQ